MRAAPMRRIFNLLPSRNSLIPRPSLRQWRSVCGAFRRSRRTFTATIHAGTISLMQCSFFHIQSYWLPQKKKKNLLHYIALSPEWDICRLMHVGLLWIPKPSFRESWGVPHSKWCSQVLHWTLSHVSSPGRWPKTIKTCIKKIYFVHPSSESNVLS